MYRRRQQRVQPKVEEVEKKVEKKEEPVIKAVVKPSRKTIITDICPMVNILRDVKYFGVDQATSHYVPFDTMIDIALSKGYLNVEQSDYYLAGEQGQKDWHTGYIDTTNYEREKFICGDVIYTHDEHASFAFLITKVYKDSPTSDAGISSELQMDPPVEPAENNTERETILSSFVACTGTVYMFKNGITLGDLADNDFVSKEGEEFRKLYPTNTSKYNGQNTNTNFTSMKTEGTKPEDYPTVDDLPIEVTDETKKNQFNLKYTAVVEGWLIYMKSSEVADNQTPSNITGDIIRTGPISISVISKTKLCLGSTYYLPFIKLDSSSSSTQTAPMTYNGDSTKFASEPLNSEHYQKNYSDSQAFKSVQVPETVIYTLSEIINKLNEENNSGDNTP